MRYKDIHKAYFIGVGGIGMSGLARFFNNHGVNVSGYDKTRTPLTGKLAEEGIVVHYEDDPDLIPHDADLYVYTPAIPDDHKGLSMLRRKGFDVKKRSEVLGLLSKDFKTIAVAGTHGKTTISSMITHLLGQSGMPVNAFIGGISKNFGSNFTFDERAEIMVVEADEYDRSFLHLNPDIAVVSAVDEDHLDVYGDSGKLKKAFAEFAGKLSEQGVAFIHSRVKLQLNDKIERITYGADEKANIRVRDIKVEFGRMIFDVIWPNGLKHNFIMGIPGRYNVENATVALAVAYRSGASPDKLRDAMLSYSGVERRFDIRVNNHKHIYVDDYAHHPEELKACIEAAREFFPGKRLTGIFQPHLYSRTRDFVDSFAQSLALLDEIVLMEIYPAREKPIPGVSSQMIARRIRAEKVRVLSKEEILPFISDHKPELLMTLGAGDIDQFVEPITKQMNSL